MAHQADSERLFEIFSEEKRLVTNELIYCSWMKRNKKPRNKGNVFFYFINSWLLSKSPPKANWPPLVYIIGENGVVYG